ncbi:MAG: DNA gyrase subunit A, partial [Pyrinomonadaceae bacterium]|nr:DNA gyrase subunit A [Pyrinomonadaceae bacterium]
ELGNQYNKTYKKSARVVGDVIGKYHPHGDTAVYDTIVRLAQDFSMRYPLVDGQGNFGCFTGETKIKLLNGTEKSFAELAELSPDEVFYVYSVDRDGRIVVGEGRHARVTRQKAQLIELTLDSGARIRCTPDHRFMLHDGTYKAAEDLTEEDSLMPGYFDAVPVKEGMNDYLRVLQPATGKHEFVHHLADRFNEQKGLAQKFEGAFVRHHKNFNRWDNRPTNIERMAFLEHLHLHAEHIAELWEDDNFRAAQREGVQRYYSNHPEVLEERRQRFITQNQDETFRRENGQRTGATLRQIYQNNPEKRAEISARMKTLWNDSDYRAKMSAALSGIEKRQLTPDEKARVAQIISEKSQAMWKDEVKRAEIIEAISHALASDEVRAKISASSRQLWQTPEYRAKYADDHFSQMAQTLWQKPATREQHRKKIAQQRKDESFRDAQRAGVRRSNAQRQQANPQMMSTLAAHAAEALTERWADPEYKRRVIRQRIARYGSSLLAKYGRESLTPEFYEAQRNANWIPRLNTALKYFKDFAELQEVSQHYNHRIVAKQFLHDHADVYDITVDVHHNFLLADGVFVHNSVDGDAAAAMRYTEVRMARLASEMLADIEKETVDFRPNYDESLSEPSVMPTRVPNLLINGSDGIAVGMATKIPPHNLTEIVDATVALLRNPSIKIEALMKIVTAPDFPTGGFIYGRSEIKKAYLEGRGILQLRARAGIDRIGRGTTERDAIIITEIPFQVNKARLIERIAELVNEKKLDGIADLRDESDRNGMRIVVELKRDAVPQVVLNKLYKMTPMQSSFGIINLAIVNGQPRVLNLKEMLEAFVDFRREVVRRRTEYDLRKARARAHILEGLNKAIDALDYIIPLIRNARSVDEARWWLTGEMKTMGDVKNWKGVPADLTLAGFLTKLQKVIKRLEFSELQAQAILDLQLRRLSALERQKILDEYEGVIKLMAELENILDNETVLRNVIVEELEEVKKVFGDKRRTEVIDEGVEFSIEDLIVNEDVAITITNSGYIKRTPVTAYTRQGRGGKGRFGASTGKNNDYVEHLFIASTHAYIMVFTDNGQVFKLKVHELPDAPTAARGKALVNLISIPSTRRLAGVVPVREFSEGRYVMMVTRQGVIKKTALSDFQNIRTNGINAINIDDGDELLDVVLTDGTKRIFIATHNGLAIRFDEKDARPMGRATRGVRGINLRKDDYVVSLCAVSAEDSERMLSVSEQGYGKQTKITDYRFQSRGGKGVINMKATEKTGKVVAVFPVDDESEIMIITQQGKLIRLEAGDIRKTGRSAQGVRLIKTDNDDKVTSASLIDASGEEAVVEETVAS